MSYDEDLPLFTVGDTANDLTGTLMTGKPPVPVDTTNITELVAHVLRPDQTVISHPASKVGNMGQWLMPWSEGDLNKRGDWQVEIESTFQDGKKKTWPPARFKVRDQFA